MTTPQSVQTSYDSKLMPLDDDGIKDLLSSMPFIPALSVPGLSVGKRVVGPVPTLHADFEAARAGAEIERRENVRVIPFPSRVHVARFDVRNVTVGTEQITEVTQKLFLQDPDWPTDERVENVFADLRSGLEAVNRRPENVLRNGRRLYLRVEPAGPDEAHWQAWVVDDSQPMDQVNLRAHAGPSSHSHEYFRGLGLPDHTRVSTNANLMGNFDPESMKPPPLTSRQLEALSQAILGLPDGPSLGVQARPDEKPLPEPVMMMGGLLEIAGGAGDLPAVLAESLAPDGLRLEPVDGADRTSAADWVRQRVADPALPGVRRVRSGADLEGLFNQSGDRGVVLLFGAQGKPEVYMRANDEVWHFTADGSGSYRPERRGRSRNVRSGPVGRRITTVRDRLQQLW